MRSHPIRKLLVVAAVTLIGVAATATPTPAAQLATGTFVSASEIVSTLSSPQGSVVLADLDAPIGGTCAPANQPPATLDIDLDAPSNGDTAVDVSGYDFGVNDYLIWWIGYFMARVVPVNDTTGVITTSASGDYEQELSFKIVFASCQGDDMCETQPIEMSLSGSYGGGVPGSRLPGTADLTGSATIFTAPGCNTLVRGSFYGEDITMTTELTLA